MAAKDVDLVVRAKDQATNVVDSITAALNEFIDAQSKLTQSAGKTNTTLGALGGALAKLDQELKGLTGGERIAQEFDKATAAMERLKTEFSNTQKTARDLSQQLQQATYQTDQLSAKAAGAAAAQAKQQVALNKTKAAQAELAAQLAKVNAEHTKFVATEDKLAASILKQQSVVAAATDRYGQLSQELIATAEPSKTLQSRVEAASASMDKQAEKLARLQGQYLEAQQGISRTGETIRSLGQQIEVGNAAVARQEAVLAKITSNYQGLQVAAKTASKNQNDIASAADKTADALARQEERINRAEVELQQFAVAANKADAAMLDLATKSGAALQDSFDKQRRAMLETKKTWVDLQAEAGRLAAEIGRVGVPTQAMVEGFLKARAGAAQAKQEYIAQRDSLQQLSAVLKTSASDIEGLRAKQAAFVTIQAQTGTALASIRQAASQSAESYNLFSSNVNRAGVAVRSVSSAIRSSGSEASGAASKTNSLADAYRKLYGESRQALSWTQRLRGEVLALISTYAGFYGVINILKQTVDAYQTLQAAQNRLNVVNEGDTKKTADDLDFLRRNADRLGISFGELAGEYSKFAVATQGTALEGERTRKIFISVAEAARVNNLSLEDVKGTFVALSQIVGKGTVQMEELRQQLGDRFPGAVRIMAAGLGYADDQLGQFYKDITNGKISSDALLQFAEELDRRFKSQLPEALKTTTTALGQFQNAAFEALLAFGNAGFLEAFTGLLRDLTGLLKSADFQTFASHISQAFGVLTSAIALAIRNFDLLVVAASAFAGIKLTPLIVALAGSFVTLVGRMQRVGAIMVATRNTMIATAASAEGVAVATGVAATAFRGLTLALRALLSSTGIGLLITAISVGIGLWVTRTDDATEAMNAHQKLVDAVKDAYDKAAGATKNWADEVARGSTTQAIANLQKFQDELQGLRDQASKQAPVDAFGVDTKGTVAAIQTAVDAFKKGTLSAADFKAEIDRIAQADPKLDRGVALQLLETADSAEAVEKKVAEAEAVLKLLKDPTDKAALAVLGLGQNSDDAAAALADSAKRAKDFQDALDKLKGTSDDTGSVMGDAFDKAKAKLDDAYDSAVKLAQTMSEINGLTDIYNQKLQELYQSNADTTFGKFTDNLKASAALIRQFEGFTPTAKFDTNAFRVGFGSDTVTLSDGTIQKVTEGTRVSVQDAERDLERRITEFQNVIKGQIGADTFNAFTPQQQAALTSIAYNYGQLPDKIVEAIKTGSTEKIADAIRGLQTDNGGINAQRRNTEAALFTSQTAVETQAQAAQDAAAKAAEEAAKQAQATQDTITAQQQEIEQQTLINDGKAREAEIEKAIAEAKKANPNITDDEIAKIREQTGALYDLKNVHTEDKQQLQEAKALMTEINALVQQRTALEQQLKVAQQQGDQNQIADTKQQLDDLNTKLDDAITKARSMWEAIGGSAANAALIKLDTASIKASTLAAKAQENYIDWNRVASLFASGLTNAFDQFAQAVAQGKDIGEAARDAFLQFAADFLRQIAQMIIQQAILNALRSFGLGGGTGVGLFHTGGVVGQGSNSSRTVDPSIFSNAIRLHTGGIPGLQPGEVPAILQAREEVLAANDPRNILNGGAAAGGGSGNAGQTAASLKIINAFDTASFIEEALNSKVGEQAFLNWVRANPNAVKQAMNP